MGPSNTALDDSATFTGVDPVTGESFSGDVLLSYDSDTVCVIKSEEVGGYQYRVVDSNGYVFPIELCELDTYIKLIGELITKESNND